MIFCAELWGQEGWGLHWEGGCGWPWVGRCLHLRAVPPLLLASPPPSKISTVMKSGPTPLLFSSQTTGILQEADMQAPIWRLIPGSISRVWMGIREGTVTTKYMVSPSATVDCAPLQERMHWCPMPPGRRASLASSHLPF